MWEPLGCNTVPILTQYWLNVSCLPEALPVASRNLNVDFPASRSGIYTWVKYEIGLSMEMWYA